MSYKRITYYYWDDYVYGIFYAINIIMKDRIAIPIWNRRISPVMDTANQLIIFSIDNERHETFKEIIPIPQTNISGRVQYILSQEITILICGAISLHFEQVLRASGVVVKPFLGGNVDDIIIAYSNGTFQSENFLLPGCKRGRRRGRRGRYFGKQLN